MVICEMCGREERLIKADVEGVELKVCRGCSKYGVVKRVNKVNFGNNKSGSFKRGFSNKNKGNRPEYRIVSNYSSLIRSAREDKGMSQEDFAKLLNERESVIAKWENGTLRPRLDIARKLGRLLKVSFIRTKKEDEKVEIKHKKKSDGFTLGDFIKVRKRK